MSAEQNKTVARRFLVEVFGGGNLDLADELIAPNHVSSGPGTLPGLPSGPEGQRQLIGFYRSAFPDVQFTVEDQIAEGERVVTRWTAQGTHTGEFAGLPPTGRAATVTGVGIDRIVDGKIVESWGIFDQFGMLQQLGAIPSQ